MAQCEGQSFYQGVSYCPAGTYFVPSSQSCCLTFNYSAVQPSPTGELEASYSFLEPPGRTINDQEPKKLQAVATEITALVLVGFITFAIFLRFMPLKGFWLKFRYQLSRFDTRFRNRHWIDEQKTNVKRFTEYGGCVTVASYIFFTGALIGLLLELFRYELLVVQKVQVLTRADLNQTVVDYHFNAAFFGNVDEAAYQFRVVTQSSDNSSVFSDPRLTQNVYSNDGVLFVNFTCLSCGQLAEGARFQFSFFDLPSPAAPVAIAGYNFSFCVDAVGQVQQESCTVGTVLASEQSRPASFRGSLSTISIFHLLPVIYQPSAGSGKAQLFEVLYLATTYGSTVSTQADLFATGSVSIVMDVTYPSDLLYKREYSRNLGALTFLEKLGGLYIVSVSLFTFIVKQGELRIRRLRYDDKLLNKLYDQRSALENWKRIILLLLAAETRKHVLETKHIKYTGDDGLGVTKSFKDRFVEEQYRHHQVKAHGAVLGEDKVRIGRLAEYGVERRAANQALVLGMIMEGRGEVQPVVEDDPTLKEQLLDLPYTAKDTIVNLPKNVNRELTWKQFRKRVVAATHIPGIIYHGVTRGATYAYTQTRAKMEAFGTWLAAKMHINMKDLEDIDPNLRVDSTEFAPTEEIKKRYSFTDDFDDNKDAAGNLTVEAAMEEVSLILHADTGGWDESEDLITRDISTMTDEQLWELIQQMQGELQATQVVLADVVSRFRPHSDM
eukprot:jgi/Chlat1/2251/Chrsp17S02565